MKTWNNYLTKVMMVVFSVFCLLNARPAGAALLFDNGYVPEYGWGGGNIQAVARADDFQLSEDAFIRRAEIYISQHKVPIFPEDVWDGTVEWWVFIDDNGKPGDVIASGSGANIILTDGGYTLENRTAYKVSFDLDQDVFIIEGNTYWFGVHLASGYPASNSATALTWDISATDFNHPSAKSQGGTFDNWETGIRDLAFSLYGDNAVLVPDQVSYSGYCYFRGCGFGSRLSQIFIPQASNLGAVDLRLRVGGGFPAVGSVGTNIMIRPAIPAGNQLELEYPVGIASASILAEQGQNIWVRFEFAAPIAVIPGDLYVIEWNTPDVAILSWMTIYATDAGESDPYKDGSAYGCTDDYFYTGTISPNDDYVFITYSYNAVNTPASGEPVVVQLTDPGTGAAIDATVTFQGVTAAGTTSLTTSQGGEPLPSGFMLGDPPVYYEITTTAEYSVPIEVCIDYSDINFVNENALTLYHYENYEWIEVNELSLDTANNIICGTVYSLSAFAILEIEARYLKEDAINALTYYAGESKQIEKSLDPKLWETDSALTKKGKKVFDEEKKAVKDLQKLIKDKKVPDSVKVVCENVIDKLLTADKSLAETALNDAKAYEGTDKKVDKEIEKSEKELEKATKELEKGKPDKAIDHYKNAWEHAQKAMNKVP